MKSYPFLFFNVLEETYCQMLTIANMNSPPNTSIKQTKVRERTDCCLHFKVKLENMLEQ